MNPLFFALVASFLSIQANSSPASPPTYGSPSRSNPLSNSWSGWSNIQNLFTLFVTACFTLIFELIF